MQHADVVRIIRILPNYSKVTVLDTDCEAHTLIMRDYPIFNDESERRCTHVETGMEWFFPAPLGELTAGLEFISIGLDEVPGIAAPEHDQYLLRFTDWLQAIVQEKG